MQPPQQPSQVNLNLNPRAQQLEPSNTSDIALPLPAALPGIKHPALNLAPASHVVMMSDSRPLTSTEYQRIALPTGFNSNVGLAAPSTLRPGSLGQITTGNCNRPTAKVKTTIVRAMMETTKETM